MYPQAAVSVCCCTQLVKPLVNLVKSTEDTIASEEEEGSEEEDEDEMGEGQGSGAANGAAKPLAVDNGDDALLLLKALAAHDEEVRTELKKGESDILSASCSIM
jgi:hypothetical protein